VSLLIETIVREDQFTLYGFCDAVEKEWFQLLTTVQGVGSKVALGILGVLHPEQLPVVIAAQDEAALRRAEGVGVKLASRIVTDLKDKAGKIALGQAAQIRASDAVQSSSGKQPLKDADVLTVKSVANDAVSALMN